MKFTEDEKLQIRIALTSRRFLLERDFPHLTDDLQNLNNAYDKIMEWKDMIRQARKHD